mmetsp:Transcript_21510/g.45673  ORF Transcript_21510/g.45673 Transcript_21510/m.45673 type:complete len:152 (+) Transcript_21510:84-539(+)
MRRRQQQQQPKSQQQRDGVQLSAPTSIQSEHIDPESASLIMVKSAPSNQKMAISTAFEVESGSAKDRKPPSFYPRNHTRRRQLIFIGCCCVSFLFMLVVVQISKDGTSKTKNVGMFKGRRKTVVLFFKGSFVNLWMFVWSTYLLKTPEYYF